MNPSIHIIKLVVGVDDLKEYYDWQQTVIFDYHGRPATPCWTRHKPTRGEEIIKSGGSLFRVIKNRIRCRHAILGFETVKTEQKGTMCMIVQSAQMIETIAAPKRPFQGWRYFKPSDAPPEKGLYTGQDDEEISPEMEEELRQAGIL